MIRIFNRFVHVRILTLFISESVLIFASFLIATYLDSDLASAPIFLIYDGGLARVGVVVLFILVGLYLRDFYVQLRIPSRVFLFQELCMIFGLSFLGQGLIFYLHREWTIPRKIMLGGSALALIWVFGWRLLFDIAARGAVQAKSILFLGLSPTVVQLAGHFNENPEFGYKPIGYLESEHGSDPVPEGMACLGTISELETVLDTTQPSSVVIGRRQEIKPWWTNDFLELRFSGVHAEQAATLYEKTFVRVCSAEIWPSKSIFGDTWRTRDVDLNLQTLYSVAIALVTLLVCFPFMLLIAVLVKLGSVGPVLVRETRIGLHEVPFTIYQFRCSRSSNGRGSLTPLGKVLRRSRLDRLPQIFNILRGHMAVVGPQADRPEFVRWLSEKIPFYRQRYQVKPGVTGWAQVHYDFDRTERDVFRRLEYDLYYVKKLSPAMDSLVLLLSIKIGLFGG